MKRFFAAAAAATALMTALSAQAATGQIGTYFPVQGTCWGNRIIVSSPGMEPSFNMLIGSDGTFVFNPSQWVRFRARLLKWDGARWVFAASSPWKARKVSVDGGTYVTDTWLNLTTNRWEAATTIFPIATRGHYKVFGEYYWYAEPSASVPSGYVSGTTPSLFDYRSGYMSVAQPWCRY